MLQLKSGMSDTTYLYKPVVFVRKVEVRVQGCLRITLCIPSTVSAAVTVSIMLLPTLPHLQPSNEVFFKIFIFGLFAFNQIG